MTSQDSGNQECTVYLIVFAGVSRIQSFLGEDEKWVKTSLAFPTLRDCLYGYSEGKCPLILF